MANFQEYPVRKCDEVSRVKPKGCPEMLEALARTNQQSYDVSVPLAKGSMVSDG